MRLTRVSERGRRGESSAALVIILMFFVIQTLIAWAVAYYFYVNWDDPENQEIQAKKQAELDKEKAYHEWYKFQALQLRAYEGDLKGVQRAKERKELGEVLRPKFDAGKLGFYEEKGKKRVPMLDRDVIVGLFAELDKKCQWDGNIRKEAALDYRKQLEEKDKEIAEAKKSAAVAAEARDKARKELMAALEKNKQDRASYSENLKKREEEHAKGLENERKKMDDLLVKYQKISEENASLRGSRTVLRAELERQNEEFRRQIELLRSRSPSKPGLRPRAKPSADDAILDNDTPKGTITDDNIDSVTISLTPPQPCQEGVTFSIVGRGEDGKPLRTVKGSLKVTKHLGNNQYRAEYTLIYNSLENPPKNGDFLFNPLWPVNPQERIAIAGVLDIAEDGRDASRQLQAFLEKQGLGVDSPLDMATRQLAGDLGPQTRYLILGGPLKGPGVSAEDQAATSRLLDQLRGLAEEKRVVVLPLKRFLTVTGIDAKQLRELAAVGRPASGFLPPPKLPAAPLPGMPGPGGGVPAPPPAGVPGMPGGPPGSAPEAPGAPAAPRGLPGGAAAGPKPAIDGLTVLSARCAACHTGAMSRGNIQLFLTPGQPNPAMDRQRILNVLAEGKMPLNELGQPTPLPAAERQSVEQFLRQPPQP